MEFEDPRFVLSAYSMKQLPESSLPEIAFAGRSNVGKSSLLNSLLRRKKLVKVSGRPGKTQALNFFLVSNAFHCVDLPGYGFARVSKSMQSSWGKLISAYLEQRNQLRCVVVIVDIRHEAKTLDSQLFMWLSQLEIATVPVYTKADKLSRSKREKHAQMLDSGHGISKAQRVIYSSKTGEGREVLLQKLMPFIK